MESRLLLDVVVTQSASILELLSSKDKTLLIRRNSFLVLDLGLHVVDGIGRLDIESDGLTGQSLDKDLHVRCLFWFFKIMIVLSSVAPIFDGTEASSYTRYCEIACNILFSKSTEEACFRD